jgi:DNA adenine methylase
MFPYIGGKSHHVRWIDSILPNGFNRYVEVFGGAGWMMLKSKRVASSQQRVYNDFNPLLANFYQCAVQDATRLLRLLEATPGSDTDRFRQYQRELFTDQPVFRAPDFDLALKYIYLQTQVFAGTPLSARCVPYFVDVKTRGRYPSKYDTIIKKLRDPKVIDRVSNITEVTQQDCIDVIDRWDSEDTLFYLDPPYHDKEFYYSQAFPKHKHEQLAERLRDIQGRFALSYYDFDDLHQFYHKDRFHWHQREVYRAAATRTSHRDNYRERSRAVEILITNYGGVPWQESRPARDSRHITPGSTPRGRSGDLVR